MNFKIFDWPILKQFECRDLHALGEIASSERTRSLTARIKNADRVVKSVCPYCAVGCGQLVYVKDERIIDIEGEPRFAYFWRLLMPKGRRDFSDGRRFVSAQ